MERRKRLLVLHRNRLFRDCLGTYLVQQGPHIVTSVDHLDANAAELLDEHEADVVLLDLKLPDKLAVEIIHSATQMSPPPKILLLASDDDDGLIECIAAGAHGCVLEQSSLDELLDAIEQVLDGEVFCSPDCIPTMFRAISKSVKPVTPKAWYEPKSKRLTLRELEVLELLNQRKSNKEIASELSVSLFTIKNHVRNILEKLNVENRMEAVDMARQQKRVHSPSRGAGL